MGLAMDALANKISQAIEEQGFSVRDAAKRCGIGLGLMSNILYGRTKRPQPETLQALASGLGLSYRELALAAYGVISDPASVTAPA